MAGARRGTNKTFTIILSDIVPVGVAIDLPGIDTSKPHCFVGAQYFSDAEGDTPAVPDSGTIAIEVESLNTSPILEIIADNIIQAGMPMTKSWAANTLLVRATPSGITIATHYRIVVTCNEY